MSAGEGGVACRLAGLALAPATAPALAALWKGSSLVPVRPARCSAASVFASGKAGDGASAQYALLRIAGDGRCLFRSLAQGQHIAAQKDAATTAAGSDGDQQQRQQTAASIQLLEAQAETSRADELRQLVCDELLRRRCAP